MPELKGSQTYQNLLQVLAREAVASRRFTFFARIAEMEGFSDIAAAFREQAESELCLADGNLDFLRQVGDPSSGLPIGETSRNLKAAGQSSSDAGQTLYPQMVRTAYNEGFPAIATWLETLIHTKNAQHAAFTAAVEATKVSQ